MFNGKMLAMSLLWVAILAFQTQAGQPPWMDTPTGKLVEEARKATKQVSIAELKKVLDADEDVTLLDVRTPREYEAVHIPGAVNAPRGLLEFSIWSLIPDTNERIYVYCKSGARAALAARQLNQFGYANAMAIDTGMTEWARSGYPVQTSITDEQIILLQAEEE